MSDILGEIVGTFIIITVVILLGIGTVSFCNTMNDSKWNNGYCTCGGKWVYDQPIGHQCSTYFLYECDKCGKTHEFSEKR